MCDTSRVNGKTIWCLKHKEDILRFSSYEFGWNLAKSLALPHVRRPKLHGLTSMVQLKMKMFLGIALEVSEPVTNIETDTNAQANGRDVKYMRKIVKVRVKKIIS